MKFNSIHSFDYISASINRIIAMHWNSWKQFLLESFLLFKQIRKSEYVTVLVYGFFEVVMLLYTENNTSYYLLEL